MKIIGSVKEDLVSEKRVSITPETVKKLIDLNSKLVRRRGRVYIINKKNPKFKARQR